MGKQLWLGSIVGAALSLCAARADAATVGLYDTGVDALGNVLSQGSTDSHWVLTGGGGTTYVLGGTETGNNNWFSAWGGDGTVGSPGSSWIGASPTNPTPAAPYTFTLTFNITGTILPITGTWYTDDASHLYANGNLIDTQGDTSQGALFSIPASDLLDGLNTIAITMYSNDQLYDGVRVTFTSPTVSSTPLPAALPLFAGGLGALGLLGWRRKRRVALPERVT
jgi:hypothetical protein